MPVTPRECLVDDRDGVPRRSAVVKSRPRTNGRPSAPKKPGPASYQRTTGDSPLAVAVPSTSIVSVSFRRTPARRTPRRPHSRLGCSPALRRRDRTAARRRRRPGIARSAPATTSPPRARGRTRGPSRERKKTAPEQPAPTSKTIAIATSATTSAVRAREPLPSVRAAVCLSSPARSVREPIHAGMQPASAPAASVIATANATTRPSSVALSSCGVPAETAPRTPTPASAKPPKTPPTAASARDSSSCSRTSDPRRAPSAVRIANSARRPLARANNRFATLAQPIAISMPTAARNTSSVDGCPARVACRPDVHGPSVRRRMIRRQGVGDRRQLLPGLAEFAFEVRRP